jgi:SWI/SNF-related matrix-associated actin-dependent regulator 1 of chromatin subfamily A
MNAHEKSMANAIELSSKTDTSFNPPCPEGLAYLPFQKAGIEFALARRNTLIADQMGLGKSIQAIGIANSIECLKSILVVCPASIKINWKREFEKWLVRPMEISIIKAGKPFVKGDITIINYDILDRYEDQINAYNYDMIIVDESHYIKSCDKIDLKDSDGKVVVNPRTGKAKKVYKVKRVRALFGIVEVCDKRVFLTGTPVLNRPKELFTTLRLLAPDSFPSSFFEYAKKYCNAHQKKINRRGDLSWDFNGFSNLEELQYKLRSTVMVRRLKEDVLKELPPKRRQIIELSLSSDKVLKEEIEYIKRIKKVKQEIRREVLEAKASNDNERYKAAVRKMRSIDGLVIGEMAELRHRTALAKVPQAVEFIENALENEDKIVVFGYHRDVIEAIEEKLNDKKKIAVKLYGGMSETAKQKSVDEFQQNDDIKVFIGQITAAGIGLTLTKASTVIFVELDWVPGNLNQCEDRLHRIGQLCYVLVIHLVFEDSIDCNMAKSVMRKQVVIDRILDKKITKEQMAIVNKTEAEEAIELINQLLEIDNDDYEDEVVVCPSSDYYDEITEEVDILDLI